MIPSPAPRPRPRHIAALALVLLPAITACAAPRDLPAHDARATTAAAEQKHAAVPHAPDAPPAREDAFAFALLGRTAADAPAGNAFVSPVSAALALSLALEGAGADTRDSLAAVLGVAGLGEREVTRRNASLIDALRGAPDVTLTVANALWARADVAFDPAFERRARGDYGAEVAALDLTTPAAVERINAWATNATAGKVTNVLSEPPPAEAMLVLTNAIYFKGQWASTFAAEATTPRPFHRGGDATVKLPTMAQTGDFAYAEGDGFRLARLPYRGARFAMYVVLPDSGRGLAATRITPARFGHAVAAAAPRKLALALPRFTMDCRVDVGRAVASLGASSAFDRTRARFDRMLAPGATKGRRVWIERATQRAVVEVNEEGTVAAAVTAIGMGQDSSAAPSAPLPFVVDRPFLFVIRDDETGALLFVGWLADPAAACGGGAGA